VAVGLAITTGVAVPAASSFTALADEPGTAVALIVIFVLSIVADLVWKTVRDTRELDRLCTAEGTDGAGGP
jgi:hypothetical protein